MAYWKGLYHDLANKLVMYYHITSSELVICECLWSYIYKTFFMLLYSIYYLQYVRAGPQKYLYLALMSVLMEASPSSVAEDSRDFMDFKPNFFRSENQG